MKKIVFVCQVFYPDATSTSQLFTALFAEMAGKEAEIEILSGFPSAQGQSEPIRPPRYEVYKGIKIHRLGLRIDLKKNLMSRGLAYMSFLIATAWKLLWMKKPDILFGVTNPPILAPMLWFLSKIKKLPYQYMVLDQYPDGLIALGMNPRSLVARFWMWLNRLAYRRAEKMVVLGRDMTTLLTTKYDVDEKNIDYIPHWSAVELEEPMPIEECKMVDDLGLRDKFIVQYSGNMGLWHDMECLVRAAQLCEDDPSIHFLFVGNGARRQGAVDLAEELGVKNITWHDFVPLEQLRESLSSCDVALISLRAGFEGVAVPSKLYGILASGRAIIAQVPPGTEVALTLDENECGLSVDPEDTEGLAAAVRELAADHARTKQYGEASFAAYRDKYRLDQALVAFRECWGLPAGGAPGEQADPADQPASAAS